MPEDVNQNLGPEEEELISDRRYHRTFIASVLAVSIVAIIPLLIMTGTTYRQYRTVFDAEMTRPMVRFTTNGKQSLESFLSEHISALTMVIRERSFEELQENRTLERVLMNLKQAFGGFIDLGVIDEDGIQLSYVGPYELEGVNYEESIWFHEVIMRGVHVSDVFMGHRNFPHFVIAIRHDLGAGHQFVLRATIDTDVLNRLVQSLVIQPHGDAFIINRDSILQTPSQFNGDILERSLLPGLPHSTQTELVELEAQNGESLIVACAPIERSSFRLVLLRPSSALPTDWLNLRRELGIFLVISIILILGVIIGGSVWMIRRMQEADRLRALCYHKMEYTNKMESLGRMSAGVAHEINNPLSIITEKAGLMKDLLQLSDKMPPREKLVELVNSVIKSADRCGGITHRLLGFAKHMQVKHENVDLDLLLREVLGFLEKEAEYRSIYVDFQFPELQPTVSSDRGQLQQVFLNILNNAFAAVDDGGHIVIGVTHDGANMVAVSIADDGIGVPEENLARIFDPFFTTKKGAGTGLGLSITYGIIEKLGGNITVESTVGEGTCFTVTLPKGHTVD